MSDIFKDLDRTLKSRRGKNKLNVKASIRYNVYKDSLNFKIRSAHYSIEIIEYLRSGRYRGKDLTFLIAYFLEHFFVSLYSCFDIAAQIINTLLKLGKNEDKIVFKTIDVLLTNREVKEYIKINILGSSKFKDFEKYRHCISHRRIPHSLLEEITHKLITPYVSSYETTDTTGKPRERKIINIYLTSNPGSFSTKVTKKIDLINYCEKLTKWTEDRLKHLLTKLARVI